MCISHGKEYSAYVVSSPLYLSPLVSLLLRLFLFHMSPMRASSIEFLRSLQLPKLNSGILPDDERRRVLIVDSGDGTKHYPSNTDEHVPTG